MVSRKRAIIAVEEKGNRCKIIKYTDFETVHTFGASEEVRGLDEYCLVTGEAVNQVSDTEFVVVISNIKLRAE